ncbi:MAG: Gfo/Idh/MocA family oxidoreductase [Spirochaetia bacterium]|nr:Gfo/Idh/MocA family oxidoreductase [Spirochaetia bacterium]
METVRFALIGYGKVAHLHAKAIQEANGAQLVAVCGRNKTRRDEFANKYNISSRDTIQEAVTYDHVDAVVISTPHPQHKENTIEAFDAGVHVLVEKPMAMNTSECTDMIVAAEKAQKVLSVVSQRRWTPSAMRMREAIDSGKLGTVALGQVTILGWRDEAYYNSDPWRGKWDTEGGGILINQAPHQLDLLHWFLGPVERIYGEFENINHPYIEVEDSAVAVIRFKNGALASLLLSNSQKPGIYAKVHIHGTSGASVGVQTDGGAMFVAGVSKTTDPPVNDIWNIEGEEELLSHFRDQDTAFFNSIDADSYFFTRQIEDVVRAIVTNCPPLVTGEDGRETVKIIEGIYKSGREINPVSFS